MNTRNGGRHSGLLVTTPTKAGKILCNLDERRPPFRFVGYNTENAEKGIVMIILKKLEFEKVTSFLKGKLADEMFLSSFVVNEFELSEGEFYTVVPDNISEQVLYNFKCGGYVYPFKREPGQNVVQVQNIARKILERFIYLFISSNERCLGIEDFNASPNSTYIKNEGVRYTILKNNLFYLLDKTVSRDQLIKYLNIAQGYIFLGFLLSITVQKIEEIRRKEFSQLSSSDIQNICDEIECFFLEIYDGESYVFWIKNNNHCLISNFTSCINEE